MRKNVFITGLPRSGKSTLLKKLVSGPGPKVGFVTSEIRQAGERVGFEMETHLGNHFILAHVDIKTPRQVSRYFVDVQALELMIPQVSVFRASQLLYIDEIGQMQLFSPSFCELVSRFLDSGNTLLATLSCVYQHDFIESLKRRDDIILVEITPENREKQGIFVAEFLRKIEKAKRYVSEPHRFAKRGWQIELQSEHGFRRIYFDGQVWVCNCGFYAQHGICSHTIATQEYCQSGGGQI